MFLLSIIFDPSGFIAHIVWYSEKTEGKKQLNFIQRLKLSKNMTFAADADIYMMKFWCL